jgi:hypothetical protein
MANERILPIKKALADRYGYKNVSVKNGTGTAWGWVEARIIVDRPADCGCEARLICDHSRAVSQEAETIARDALKNVGLEFYKYSSDMGGDHDEFLLQVRYK